MKWTVIFAALVAAFTWADVPQSFAGDVSDVVRARANARAGGGTSGHDAYILKKHGGALSGTKAKKKAAAKRKAAARKRAAAAKKKKAAQRRAAIAAKKKAEAKRRAAIAAKKKAAAKRRAAAATKDAESGSNGGTVTAPSTAAVLTNQEINSDEPEKSNSEKTEDVAVATDNNSSGAAKSETTSETDSKVGEAAKNADGECKRFVPEVGKTVTVDC